MKKKVKVKARVRERRGKREREEEESESESEKEEEEKKERREESESESEEEEEETKLLNLTKNDELMKSFEDALEMDIEGDTVIVLTYSIKKYHKEIYDLKNENVIIVQCINISNKSDCKQYKIIKEKNRILLKLYVEKNSIFRCKENLKTFTYIRKLFNGNENDEQNVEKNNVNVEKNNEKKEQNYSYLDDKYFKIMKKGNINVLVQVEDKKSSENNINNQFKKIPYMQDYLIHLTKHNHKVDYYPDEQILINVDEKLEVSNMLYDLFQNLFVDYLNKNVDIPNKKQRFIKMKKFMKDCIEDEKCDKVDASILKEKMQLLGDNLNIIHSIFYEGSDFDNILYNKLKKIVIFPIYYMSENNKFSYSFLIYKNLKIYRFVPPTRYFNQENISNNIDDYLDKVIKNSFIHEDYGVTYKGLLKIENPMDEYKIVENNLWNNYLMFLIITNPQINIDKLNDLIQLIMKVEDKSRKDLYDMYFEYLD